MTGDGLSHLSMGTKTLNPYPGMLKDARQPLYVVEFCTPYKLIVNKTNRYLKEDGSVTKAGKQKNVHNLWYDLTSVCSSYGYNRFLTITPSWKGAASAVSLSEQSK
jgi:hypothetical protein